MASIKISSESCLMCGTSDETYELKMTVPKFDSVVCSKHLRDIVKREKKSERKKASTNGEVVKS